MQQRESLHLNSPINDCVCYYGLATYHWSMFDGKTLRVRALQIVLGKTKQLMTANIGVTAIRAKVRLPRQRTARSVFLTVRAVPAQESVKSPLHWFVARLVPRRRVSR